jgi:hypothetical protein
MHSLSSSWGSASTIHKFQYLLVVQGRGIFAPRGIRESHVFFLYQVANLEEISSVGQEGMSLWHSSVGKTR